MKLFKLYSVSNFQIYNTALLTVFTILLFLKIAVAIQVFFVIPHKF